VDLPKRKRVSAGRTLSQEKERLRVIGGRPIAVEGREGEVLHRDPKALSRWVGKELLARGGGSRETEPLGVSWRCTMKADGSSYEKVQIGRSEDRDGLGVGVMTTIHPGTKEFLSWMDRISEWELKVSSTRKTDE